MSGSKKRGSHFKRRRRRGSHLGVTGKFPSTLNDHSLLYESLRERDLFVLLEFQDGVDRVDDHPFPIGYTADGKSRRYTPDALVRFKDDRPAEVIEVKVTSELERKSPEYESTFAAARTYCQARDMRFRVTTEREMPQPRMANLRFLWPYRAFPKDERAEALILEALRSCSTVEDVVGYLNGRQVPDGDAIAQVWRLVACQQVETELDEPLSMRSRLIVRQWSLQL